MSEISLNELYKKLVEAIQRSENNTKKEIEKLNIANKKIVALLEEQNQKIEKLENKYRHLELQTLNQERLHRKNNIIVYGLACEDQRDELKLIKKLSDLLKINISECDINNAYILKSNREIPPIKIELLSYLKKKQILKNARNLKGTQIFITQDMCYEDRKEHKILKEHLKLAKSKNYHAHIKGNKLFINDEVYTVKQLQEINDNEGLPQGSSSESPKAQIFSNSAPSTPSRSVFDECSSQVAINQYTDSTPDPRITPTETDNPKKPIIKNKNTLSHTQLPSPIQTNKDQGLNSTTDSSNNKPIYHKTGSVTGVKHNSIQSGVQTRKASKKPSVG